MQELDPIYVFKLLAEIYVESNSMKSSKNIIRMKKRPEIEASLNFMMQLLRWLYWDESKEWDA